MGTCRIIKTSLISRFYSNIHVMQYLRPLNMIKSLNIRNHLDFQPVIGTSALIPLVSHFANSPTVLTDDGLIASARDDLRRQEYNRIIGKIGIKKRDAGIYWNQYKTKRIKIKRRRRVI